MSLDGPEHFGEPFIVTFDSVPDVAFTHAEYFTLDVVEDAAPAAITAALMSVTPHADSKNVFQIRMSTPLTRQRSGP
jgi:hypothetical protein